MVLRSCFAMVAVSLMVAGCAAQTGTDEPTSNGAAVGSAAQQRDVVVFQSEADRDEHAKALSSPSGGIHAEAKKTCTVYDAATFYILTGITTSYGGMICE